LDNLRRLLNAGVPVIVVTLLHPGEDTGHYRLVVGYDLPSRTMLLQDSYYGPELWVRDDDFLAAWQPFFYVYLPLYRPRDEELVKSLLTPDWDDATMKARAFARASEEAKASPQDAYVWYNLGQANFLLGDMEAAVAAYEHAVSMDSSGGIFWYQSRNFLAAKTATGRVPASANSGAMPAGPSS